MKDILVVEDEKIMAKNIKFFLEKEGYRVDTAYDGEDALVCFRNKAYDLVLLDWSLPKKDGLEVCREIRRMSAVPVMMLTAKGELMDKVIGLELGADDYMVKPFHQRELLARIHALLRRNTHAYPAGPEAGSPEYGQPERLALDGLTLERDTMRIVWEGTQESLTATEYKLLDLMMRRPDNVFARELLFERVWGSSDGYNDRTVDVGVSRLRRKLQELTGKRYLQAVRGMGYRFNGES